MGTRSTTHIYSTADGEERHILSFYRQMDGYLEGHGKELAFFLAGGRVVNGFSFDGTKQFNGPEDLAAQVLCRMKLGKNGEPETGHIYVSTEKDRQLYNYFIYVDGPGKPIRMKVVREFSQSSEVVFEGTAQQLMRQFLLSPEQRAMAVEMLVNLPQTWTPTEVLRWAITERAATYENYSDEKLAREFRESFGETITDYLDRKEQ